MRDRLNPPRWRTHRLTLDTRTVNHSVRSRAKSLLLAATAAVILRVIQDLWMEVLMSGQPGRFLVGIGEGAELLLGGLAGQFKLRAEQTGGLLSITDMTLDPHAAPCRPSDLNRRPRLRRALTSRDRRRERRRRPS
jgi:hypothetical protein